VGGVAGKTTAATRNKESDKTVVASLAGKGNLPRELHNSPLGRSLAAVGSDKGSGQQMRATGSARPPAVDTTKGSVKGKSGAAAKDGKAPTLPQAPCSPGKAGKLDYQGEAHKLFMTHGKNNFMSLKQFGAMVKALQKEGTFRFPSEEKLQAFVSREFAKHDVEPKNAKLSFDEFLEFFGKWMDESAREQVDAHHKTHQKGGAACVETAFMRYDADHDFNMTTSELRNLVEDMQPAGQPKPPENELQACVDEIMMANDLNANGGLTFEEFSEGYKTLLDRVDALHKAQRRKVMETQVGFRGMIRDETDEEKLEQATKSQYDGHLWVVSEHQMPEAEQRAKQAGRFALFLDAPPGNLDLPTERYAKKMGGRCKVFDLHALVMSIGHRKATDDEAVEQLREAVLACMETGTQLVLRLGNTAPDLMGSWNRKDLPLDFLLPENAAAGPLAPGLHSMVRPPAKPSTFAVAAGYRLVVTSTFDMNNYHGFLRSKLPLGSFQPIQVMPSLAEVADVLEYGLPKSSDDDAFAEMDRLADML